MEAIIGHKTQKHQLGALIQRQAVPHALMFAGPSGIGKRSTALAFAGELLAQGEGGSLTPEEVRKMAALGTHPDLHLVKRDPEKKDLSVEAIRSVCNTLQLKPYYGRCAVAIFDNAHEMNLPASNALLKTLEEPPANTYLILVTDSPQTLPETIVSRCQLLNFSELSAEEIELILQRILKPLPQVQPLIPDLVKYCGSSLSPLGISSYCQANLLNIKDFEGLNTHLESLLSQVKALKQKIAPLISTRQNKKELIPYAVSLATMLTEDKEQLGLSWHTLHSMLRQKVRDSSLEHSARWAEALLASIEAEQLSRQRNLNPQLQLSTVLLKVAEAASQ